RPPPWLRGDRPAATAGRFVIFLLDLRTRMLDLIDALAVAAKLPDRAVVPKTTLERIGRRCGGEPAKEVLSQRGGRFHHGRLRLLGLEHALACGEVDRHKS